MGVSALNEAAGQLPVAAGEACRVAVELNGDVEQVLGCPIAQQGGRFGRKEETALALQCDAAVGVHHQHLAVAAHHIETILLEVEAEGAQYGVHGVLCHKGGGACDVVLQQSPVSISMDGYSLPDTHGKQIWPFS